jgi:hypothetical protein
MGGIHTILANPLTHSIPLEFDHSLNQQININGPAQTVHNEDYRGLSETMTYPGKLSSSSTKQHTS